MADAHAGGMGGVDASWKIWVGDCLERLADVASGSVALVLTSPPYNIGKPYEQRIALADYIAWTQAWLDEVRRVLAPDGATWINLGFVEVAGEGRAVPLPYLLWPYLDLYLMQEVVWRYESGVACRRRLSPRNEKLLWLVRDPSAYTFNLDAIRDPVVRYPNQTRNGRLRCNPRGKNPGDVWLIPKVTAGRAVAERTDHPAQSRSRSRNGSCWPVPSHATWFWTHSRALARLLAATMHDRRAIGIERDTRYAAIAEQRLRGCQ